MAVVCGADGCRGGWVAVYHDLRTGKLSSRVVGDIGEIGETSPKPSVIAVDIPIGLTDKGARSCDMLARRLLGVRASSVFPAPLRQVLRATSHAEASAISRSLSGKGMSIQAWGIVPKVRQVDAALWKDRTLREMVREVHPEVSFYYLAGGHPMKASKKSQLGRDERIKLLRTVYGAEVDRLVGKGRRDICAADDILDAVAATWTAARILNGGAVVIPDQRHKDRFGLYMEIIA